VNGTAAELCPMAGFDISFVEPSCSVQHLSTRDKLVTSLVILLKCV
jgi:hypothetical protein